MMINTLFNEADHALVLDAVRHYEWNQNYLDIMGADALTAIDMVRNCGGVPADIHCVIVTSKILDILYSACDILMFDLDDKDWYNKFSNKCDEYGIMYAGLQKKANVWCDNHIGNDEDIPF